MPHSFGVLLGIIIGIILFVIWSARYSKYLYEDSSVIKIYSIALNCLGGIIFGVCISFPNLYAIIAGIVFLLIFALIAIGIGAYYKKIHDR